MTGILNNPNLQSLAWTLVHFLWQGAALGLLAFTWFRRSRSSSAARYMAGVATLAAMLAAPAMTFTYLARQNDPRVIATDGGVAFTPAANGPAETGPYAFFSRRPRALATSSASS